MAQEEPTVGDVLGELNEVQIEDVLGQAVIGRIGCISDGRPYVVPVSQVCFEVESVEDLQNWQSVIATGVFEDLSEQEQREGMQLLIGGSCLF